MALINYEIAPRSYELIRDRVGLILTDEIAQQAAITYEDYLYKTSIFVQRSKPVTPEECPLINISIDSGQYENQTIIDSDGEYTFFIDVFSTGAYNDVDRGDKVAAFEAQKLAGIVEAILSSPEYCTLGFASPFIMRAKIQSFEPGTIERGESTNLSIVRITFKVKASQTEPASLPITEFISQTQVFIHDTGDGYLYSTNGTYVTQDPEDELTVKVLNTLGDILTTKTVNNFDYEIEIQNVLNVDSDGSIVSTAAGVPFVCSPLEDTTYNIYVNGVLDQTFTIPTEDLTINIEP